MTSTLIDVRDWHRTRELSFARQQSPQLSDEHKQMADAIDAHIAAMGEPVAWQYRELGKPWRTVSKETYDRYCVGSGYECRTLFAAPPASTAIAAVRRVIDRLNLFPSEKDAVMGALTAALPENAK